MFEHRGFTFSSSEGPIAGAAELRALSEALGLGAIPLPEMVFARNCVSVAHAASGARLRFSAEGAARAWHARQLRALGPAVDATRFDWSYATDYDGDTEGPGGGAAHGGASGGCDAAGAAEPRGGPSALPAARAAATPLRLPLARLQQRGAILFFAAAPLLGSDLSDRGFAECTVKLRVMEDCFLVLLRCFVRLDRASVWLRDVRLCHVFGETDEAGGPLLLRDVQLREAALPSAPPLTSLLGGELGAADGDGGDGGGEARDVLLPGPPPSFFASGGAAAAVTAAASPSPPALLMPAAASPPSAAADAAASPAPAAPCASSPPTSPPKIHPLVLESMRARAARAGMAVAEDGTLLTSPGGPPAAAPRGGGLPADLVAARFLLRDVGAVPPPPPQPVALGRGLRLDCTADDVYDAVPPAFEDTVRLEF